MTVKLPDIVTLCHRININKKGTYTLSTVTSLARGAESSGSSRSTRGSRGTSHTRLTTVSLQEQISSETMLGS